MSNMGFKRAKLALMLVLGVALWGSVSANLASALTTAEEFITANANDNLVIKYSNYENEVRVVGDKLNGILVVTTIEAFNNSGVEVASWSGSQIPGTDQLVGQFDSLTVNSITSSGGQVVVNFTGGELALYEVLNGVFNPAAASGITPADAPTDICGGACPAPLVTADFASGETTDSTVTLSSTVNSLSAFAHGSGAGFLDTDTNSFGTGSLNNLIHHQAIDTAFGPRDLFLNSSLSAPCSSSSPTNCGNWPVYSNDPVTNPVPEPASVVLVGAGLGALGLWRRIHRSAQS